MTETATWRRRIRMGRPLFWPFAYFDMYNYAMWGYGYDDIYAGMFSPDGYDDLAGYYPPQYASANPSDRGPASTYARANRSDLRRAARAADPQRAPIDQLTQMCGVDSRDIAGLPIDQFQQSIQSTDVISMIKLGAQERADLLLGSSVLGVFCLSQSVVLSCGWRCDGTF